MAFVQNKTCSYFRTKILTSTMTEKAWNSLKWEPDFARPDKVTSQLNDITNVVNAKNGSKYLEINETAFNNADHNYVYASEFDQMKRYRDSSHASSGSRSGCDSSSSRTGASVSGGWGPFSASVSASHSSSKSSCRSLFSAKSGRSINNVQGTSSSTDTEKKQT